MDNSKQPYCDCCVYAEVIVRSASIDPQAAADALGLESAEVWYRGQPMRDSRGTHFDSGFSIHSAGRRDGSVQDAFVEAIGCFMNADLSLDQLRMRYGASTKLVGVCYVAHTYPIMFVSRETVRRISELGLDVDIELYNTQVPPSIERSIFGG